MTKLTIHGHRGSRGTHPENSLPSFREAFLAGAAFVELDVHLSRDGHLVIHHDPEISGRLCRNPDGTALASPVALASLTLAEIQAFDYGSIPHPGFPEQTRIPGARIPSLEELIRWKLAEAPSLRLNVEIKTGSAEPDRLARDTVALLAKHRLVEESLVQSFDFDIVRAARRCSSSLRLSCLFEEPADFAAVATLNGAQVAAIHHPLIDAHHFTECRRAGLEVLPWTVNHPDDLRRLTQLGITSVITDYPRQFMSFS